MKTLISIFIFTFLILQGCIKAPSNARKSSSSSATSTSGGTTSGSGGTTFASDELLYWFTTSKILGTVTINKNNQDVIYLRGKNIHDFLNAKDSNGTEYFRKQYCLVGSFGTDPAYKQLRVRAIPINVATSSKTIERLFRIDLPVESDNASSCPYITYDPATKNYLSPPATAFSLPTLCAPTATNKCSSQITSSNLSIFSYEKSFQNQSNILVKILSNSLNLSSALLRVDLSSNSGDPVSSCSNSSCSAKGFDCCISGQCVKDGTEKLSAKSDLQYGQATLDYAINPLNFIYYPNIYNICSNIAHTPPATPVGSGNTPISDAQLRVSKYLTDYICITSPVDANGISSCTTYDATKTKLAKDCGCVASPADMPVKCPDWGILPVYKSGATKAYENITDFTCYTPAPANPIGPITNLNVSVSNRSAPHRFFSEKGNSYDDISALKTKAPATDPTPVQEGEGFYYLDEYNKFGPINGSFNINSVLGSMTIDLSHTLPAKEVDVELGKTYILSATSGYFTPCSQCAKDSWFQTFTAHPTSQRGTGLQASGYTTSRDTFSGNNTFGNYEDTQFGRACYVPATMLPLSHKKNADAQLQRKNRLKTQASFYINGYQKDWFGFNKGALIGSFDGVTWFAIGTGRRITSTTTKLYLALNSSFLDLADKTDTIVNIIPDFSANIAADYDYNPDVALTDPRQNTGATCQRYHQCATDADCVTQLGWEYVCADVSQYKTKWPVFDSSAKETSNQEFTGSLFEILQNTISTTNPRRCVYRGQGSPCKRNYATLTNELDRKFLTCAPNFYCASLTTNNFNAELVRSPNDLNDILFGMDANILGRPLDYVTASTALPIEAITNIQYNAASITSETDDMGICRPGKLLSLNNVAVENITSHQAADPSKRTDYISQISSCNSNAIGDSRFLTCPGFDDTLNYPNDLDTSSTTNTVTARRDQKQTQNACGGEAKNSSNVSGFKSIEGISLFNLHNMTQPILAQDACLRRAGSVCHTDLDCGPNKMHEDLVGSLSITYFGGTEAEQQYWKESLVCGQGDPVPAIGSSKYFSYQLNANRCCRETGKDFTMYTEGPKALVPENASGSNETLKTDRESYQNPTASGRYSRYTVSKTLLDTVYPKAPEAALPFPKVATSTEPISEQWKVINETGSLTCCGGGWIRKFTDGTHDWKIRNRLSLDTNNFNCLNFRSQLASANYNQVNAALDNVWYTSYQKEYEYFCKSPDIAGCMQIPFQNSNVFSILGPLKYVPRAKIKTDPADPAIAQPEYSRIDTSPTADPVDGSTPWTQITNSDVPYSPLAFYYIPYTYDLDFKTNKSFNFFTNKDTDYGVEMYLPAYLGWDGAQPDATYIKKVSIKYFYGNTKQPIVVDITAKLATPVQCALVFDVNNAAFNKISPIDAIPDSFWCIANDNNTHGRPTIAVRASNLAPVAGWKYAGVQIDFLPIEQYNQIAKPLEKIAEPGNALYYLSKLARMELIGIPQITYEPLYCNSNQEKVVPGIFKSTYSTRAIFEANSNQYTNFNPILSYKAEDSINHFETPGYGNLDTASKWHYTYQDKLDHPAIFSSKDFTCCTPLGKATSAATRCCSGYAQLTKDGKSSICKLPIGTDLNVYFNKFVSSEGVGANQPGGGLVIKTSDPVADPQDTEVDFNAFTGEPKFRGTTYDKLVALGAAYCANGKVATGGAFGAFPPEPFSGSYTVQAGATGNLEASFPLSIVDSVLDFQGSDANVGKIPFDSGFKWNHHYYCK